MSRKVLLSLLFSLNLLFLAVILAVSFTVVTAEGSRQTWPSRTPTSAAGQTPPPGGSTPGGGETAIPTSELPATGEATPTTASTPVGGLTPVAPPPTPMVTGPAESPFPPPLPAATDHPPIFITSAPKQNDACGIPPYVQAFGSVSVRQGAGIDHDVVGQLGPGDVRTITGRAASSPWWLILFAPDRQGWVSDPAVSVNGYTGQVPIIETDDTALTAGAQWNPTPNPSCTPPAVTIEPSVTAVSIDSELESGTSGGSDSDSGEQSTSAGSISETDDSATGDRNSNTLNDSSSDGQSANSPLIWLLITGVFLVVVGTISFIMRKRNY